jgi:hypothetical protein
VIVLSDRKKLALHNCAAIIKRDDNPNCNSAGYFSVVYMEAAGFPETSVPVKQ